MFKVTEDMTIMDVLRQDKEVAYVFMKHGLHCLGCPGATMESIKDAANVHGIDLNSLLNDLNKFFEEKSK
ncbi:hybrid cluster protein-associated redox disulfide domain-containing protein [Alkalithermobacter thermoalcaliphilus JW-YL-7 = DSM 7308]|uniref:Hybrid cluster protein-associated redox disulfide domain-containing protein n=1 Tax=Alkalithermobacter thermoalcaliphilus JW-YL-7 = DSM 7308 TaxID=1121328 RepID=A0A150FSY5_CLOPD|nr:Conserved hypothetical protein CHP03980, redox-disulfide [[Clostridium] paradoxum JW-YL-7 = DSM 7308]SHL09565.1 hybrid cluster protein-associated redox disulfide domain-containing protein [[Clostridium] paradoxum JW-YL-7 = DSM 7308]